MSDIEEREPDITWDQADQALRRTEQRFEAGDVQGLLSRYDDNIVIRFAGLPDIVGKAAAEAFFRARFAKQRNYKLKKTLFSVSGQKVSNSWTGQWDDVETGKRMEGYGVECLELQGGKVVRWEAAFNVWETGRESETRYFQLA